MPAAGLCVRAAAGADVRCYISGQAVDLLLQLLAGLSEGLASAAESDDGDAFLETDTAFHLLLLEGSGNPVIAQFALVVTAALHTQLARAIASRDAVLAERLATEIADVTLTEFS